MKQIDIKEIEALVRAVIEQMSSQAAAIPVGVSNRHLHVDRQTLAALFGQGYELTKLRNLKQPGQYAAVETVDITGPKGELRKVRILGPVRNNTQVEISKTESFLLGLDCPVRESGDIGRTPGIVLKGPQGEVTLDQGVIVALRHIHMSEDYAVRFGYRDGQRVAVRFSGGERKTVFEDVKIQVSSQFVLEMHVDTDEANAAGLQNGSAGEIIQIRP